MVGKYYIRTWGCQMNERDSEVLAGQLEAMGYEAAEGPEEADVVLLNTCTVRDNADQKQLGEIGRLKPLKAARPEMILGVAGCMAQVPEAVERIRRQAPFVDLVFGTHNLHRLPELIERARRSDEMVVDVWQYAEGVQEHLPSRRASRVRAWVNIIYGCDKYCTYCIVPTTRGRERSRRPEEILAEVRGLVDAGYKEITLLGQNVNSYGHDLPEPYDFADLLREIDRVPGIGWVRYMTSHPRDFTPKLIETLAESEHICEHIHLPVQSGSDAVLRRMNRKYTVAQYLETVDRIRARIPEATLTTDIIVGFPGETEADFEATLDLVRRVRYDNAFTFVYSPRAGTVATRWLAGDPTTEEEKHRRLERLNDVVYAIAREKNETLVGREFDVLVEGPSKKDPSVFSARTRGNKLVLVPGGQVRAGEWARVRITRAHTWTLEAEAIGRPAGAEPAPGLVVAAATARAGGRR
ncbi:MAG: tRNA (N6-isopentenyl adenosine(37)-C2)-methylthiotransferase MiaB [Bacillota bacterium]|nr:tRNA (N6-isopentenyl adenosine(37)-C2)-methylthiotransferase MiaB [Bacillota bacterium]